MVIIQFVHLKNTFMMKHVTLFALTAMISSMQAFEQIIIVDTNIAG